MKSMEIKKQVNRLEKHRHSDSLWIRAGKVGREYLKQKAVFYLFCSYASDNRLSLRELPMV